MQTRLRLDHVMRFFWMPQVDKTEWVGQARQVPAGPFSRLVLEDLVIVEDGTVVAGSVLFSFTRFHERFGMNMEQIHSKVPQYQNDLEKPVAKVFATLRDDRPMWRSNWNVSWSDDIMAGYSRYPHRNQGISTAERNLLFEELKYKIGQKGLAESAWLKVEYQTLRRLCHHPSSVLFTIRTFINSFQELESEPLAAKALLQNMDRLQHTEFKKYIGIDDVDLFQTLRSFVQDACVE